MCASGRMDKPVEASTPTLSIYISNNNNNINLPTMVSGTIYVDER